MAFDSEIWTSVGNQKLNIVTLFSTYHSDEDPVKNQELCKSFQGLIQVEGQQTDSNLDLGKLFSSVILLAFPPKNEVSMLSNSFQNFQSSINSAQIFAQSFLQSLLTSLYLENQKKLSTFLEIVVTTCWLDIDTLKRFLVYCINILVAFKSDKNFITYQKAVSLQAGWTIQREPHLSSAIIEVLVPFPPSDVIGHVTQIFVKGCEINWKFALMFASTFIVCTDDQIKSQFKDFVSNFISESLETDNQVDFVIAILFVRQICNEPEVTSHSFSNYKIWFETTFSNESTSLANTKKKILTLCKFLSGLVPFETSSALRAHLNRPPFIPLQLRQVWSDYFNLARTRLSDLGTEGEVKTVPIFGPATSTTARPGSQELVEIDNDIRETISNFVKNGGKIPSKILEASVFRRVYFEAHFLPRLVNIETAIEGVDQCDRKRLIVEFEAKSKIPKGLLKQFPVKKDEEKMLKTALKRKN